MYSRRQFLTTARDLTLGGLASLVLTSIGCSKSDEETIEQITQEYYKIINKQLDGYISKEDTIHFAKFYSEHTTERLAKSQGLPSINFEELKKEFLEKSGTSTEEKAIHEINITNITINEDQATVIYDLTLTVKQSAVTQTIPYPNERLELIKVNDQWKIDY